MSHRQTKIKRETVEIVPLGLDLPRTNQYLRKLSQITDRILRHLQQLDINHTIIERWTPTLYVGGTAEAGSVYDSEGAYIQFVGEEVDYIVAHGRVTLTGTVANTGNVTLEEFPFTFSADIPSMNMCAGFRQSGATISHPTIQCSTNDTILKFWKQMNTNAAFAQIQDTEIPNGTVIQFSFVSEVQKS